MLQKTLFAVLFCGTLSASAYLGSATSVRNEMNGIKLTDYPGFSEKWRLVTVRFRADTQEMRFTYANPLAWKGLKSVKPQYEDGAVFAKIGLITEDDPAFPSSKVPSRSKRFQFMVHDKKKYSSTDGWGYALFDTDGKTFDEDPVQKTLACVACHRIVPERDFVFSRELQLNPWSKNSVLPEPGKQSQVQFVPRPWSYFKIESLSGAVENGKNLESLEGNLQKNVFSGTFDEIVPLLIDQAKKMSRHSIFFFDKNNFSLVRLVEKGKACPESVSQKLFSITVVFNGKRVRDAESCL